MRGAREVQIGRRDLEGPAFTLPCGQWERHDETGVINGHWGLWRRVDRALWPRAVKYLPEWFRRKLVLTQQALQSKRTAAPSPAQALPSLSSQPDIIW